MNNVGRKILSDEVLKQCSSRILHEATRFRLLRVKNMRRQNNNLPTLKTYHPAHLHQLHLRLNVHLARNFFQSVVQDRL